MRTSSCRPRAPAVLPWLPLASVDALAHVAGCPSNRRRCHGCAPTARARPPCQSVAAAVALCTSGCWRLLAMAAQSRDKCVDERLGVPVHEKGVENEWTREHLYPVTFRQFPAGSHACNR